jgi:ABC-type Na+ efflux pump permease subunit
MARKDQFIGLVKQELRRLTRSKGILFVIFIIPILLWIGQVAFLNIEFSGPTNYAGEDMYFINNDQGSDSINYGEFVISGIEYQIDSNESFIYEINLIEIDGGGLDFNEIYDLVRTENYSPLVYIPDNFTQVYDEFNMSAGIITQPFVDVLYLPTDQAIGNDVRRAILNIVYEPPFTILERDSLVYTMSSTIIEEGEQESSRMISYMITFFVMYIAVFVPAPFVSSAFAEERELRTLEGLMVLPIRRTDIFVAKITASSLLLGIFSLLTSLGLYLYVFIVKQIDKFSEVGAEYPLFTDVLILFVAVWITSITGLTLGISLTSGVKDRRNVNTAYNLPVLMPFAIIAILVLMNGFPEGFSFLYLIPWTHSLAIAYKGLFPNSPQVVLLTGSMGLDMLIHVGALLLTIIICVIIAAKIQERIFRISGGN